jgi:hypothetical protein
MRTLRSLAAATAAMIVIAIPTGAFADGGAYVEFDRTHHLPGSIATGKAFVSVPESKQQVLDQGPFYVFVLPPRAWIQEGRPIPDEALRVGTVTIERTRGTEFELEMSFVVPDLAGNYYTVAVCNDPCTIAGFREPLTGEISIIATSREGQLLTENSRMWSKTWSLRREVHKVERANEQLEDRLEYGTDQLLQYLDRIEALEGRLAARNGAALASSTTDDRPIIDPWAFVAILGALIFALTAIALAVVFSRRVIRVGPPEPVPRIDAELELLLDAEPEDELTSASRLR